MPSYSDPLFGIVILLCIIALAVLIDYGRNRYKDYQKQKSLGDLQKSYEFVGLKEGVGEFLSLGESSLPTLQFIAQAHIQSGNAQEAIKIYLSILEYLDSLSNADSQLARHKAQILRQLGEAYFSAGFLQRAKNIFLEILKNYPRSPEVLIYLLRTYESLSEYQNAIDALDCIEEIYEHEPTKDIRFLHSITLNRAYLRTLVMMNDHTMPLSKKLQSLERLKEKHPRLEKTILAFYKSINHTLFWDEIEKSSQILDMIDLIWDFEASSVPLHKFYNDTLLDVARAKGWLNDDKPCQDFWLECVRLLRVHSKMTPSLSFEYRCHGCKQIFPFENARCSCGELLNTNLLYKPRKVANEANYPLL